jgi:hypothetical protein
MFKFTKDDAEALAKLNRDYTIKKARWSEDLYYVWCKKSDHLVEFDRLPHDLRGKVRGTGD